MRDVPSQPRPQCRSYAAAAICPEHALAVVSADSGIARFGELVCINPTRA